MGLFPVGGLTEVDRGTVIRDTGVGSNLVLYTIKRESVREPIYLFAREFLDCYPQVDMKVRVMEDEKKNCFAIKGD